ncbi:MAG TPA: methyltransferase domain-containing protein [Candidatus Saccharimonadaceae bacterium]|nr:methyltransferase domain-containing protein [Candidatus Saccharimonadaceae bacterium]
MARSAEWDAATYHRIADPQWIWGQEVLSRLPLVGDETVLDLGCGSGRLTALLADRVPEGRVIGVDRSARMLAEAARQRAPEHAARLHLVRADLPALPLGSVADAVFSNATFHWIADQAALFREIGRVLRPGARLVAQCGGLGNLATLHERAARHTTGEEMAPRLAGWRPSWHFSDPPTTRRHLEAAGFRDIEVALEPRPTHFAGENAYRAFVEHVVMREWLARLDDATLVEALLDRMCADAARDTPPWTLDYVRLNLSAMR